MDVYKFGRGVKGQWILKARKKLKRNHRCNALGFLPGLLPCPQLFFWCLLRASGRLQDLPQELQETRKVVVLWHESVWRRASASRPNRMWHCLQVPPRPFFFPIVFSFLPPPPLVFSALTVGAPDGSGSPLVFSGMVVYVGSTPRTSLVRVSSVLGIVC